MSKFKRGDNNVLRLKWGHNQAVAKKLWMLTKNILFLIYSNQKAVIKIKYHLFLRFNKMLGISIYFYFSVRQKIRMCFLVHLRKMYYSEQEIKKNSFLPL